VLQTDSVILLNVYKSGQNDALGMPLQFHIHMRTSLVLATGMPFGNPRLDSVV